MHLSIFAAGLATLPALSTATNGLAGFALGTKIPSGACKVQADYEADFDAIVSSNAAARIVRIYAASECSSAALVLPAAKAKGFRVVLGIWPDTDDANANDKAAVVAYAPQFADQVYAVTVRSEALYRGTFNGEQLLTKIKDVKAAVPQFKVGTADSWNKYADGTADVVITGGVDILLCNGFSYWQGQGINNASSSFFDDMYQAFSHIQTVAGSADKIELWVGETGWPSAGTTYQNAVPGVEAAARYYQEAFCAIQRWGINAFFFEAFDEPWKPVSKGQDGSVADETHWGAMNADRSAKYSLTC